MLTILLVGFGIIYLVLALVAYSKTQKIIKFYKQKYPRLQNLPQHWGGFIRQDKHQWDQKQIIKGCFLRFPFKIFIFVQYVVGCFVIMVVTLPLGAKFCNKILRVYGRNYGTHVFKLIWNIKDPEGINKKVLTTPIVISNHVCWIDTMYLIVTFYPISFLSKSQIANVPIFGKITTNAQSIYIQRNDQKARQKIIKDIRERVITFTERLKNQVFQEVFPLIIFPEGTTSNGRSLLKFKMGAFNDLSPLTIVGLNYTCNNFDVGMVQITQLEHLIISFCLRINLQVKIQQIQPKKNEKPEEYCSRAQKTLTQMLGYKSYNSGYRERQQHKKLIKQAMESNKTK